MPLRLDFKNLPLAEAAVRASLAEPIELTIGLLTRLHALLQGEFPRLRDARQIDTPPGITGSFTFEPGRLLGGVFEGHAEGIEVSVQPQVVVVRWRRSTEPGGPEYPRFARLRDSLVRTASVLNTALGGRAPRTVVSNMSYVNFLAISHDEPILARYFSSVINVPVVETAKQVRKVEVSWQESDDVDLRVSIEQGAARAFESPVEGFQLTTAGGLRLREGRSTDPATGLDLVHDRLQTLFHDLLSDRAKQEWGLEVRHGST